MGWSFKDLSIAGFTLIGVFPALLIIGIIFVIGGISLYVAGLVSAMIYFLAGVGVIWILKVLGVFKYPLGYLSLLILPVAAFVGWGVDNLTFLSWAPSPAEWVASQPSFTVPMNDLFGVSSTFSLNLGVLGVIFVFSSMILVTMLTAVLASKKRKKR